MQGWGIGSTVQAANVGSWHANIRQSYAIPKNHQNWVIYKIWKKDGWLITTYSNTRVIRLLETATHFFLESPSCDVTVKAEDNLKVKIWCHQLFLNESITYKKNFTPGWIGWLDPCSLFRLSCKSINYKPKVTISLCDLIRFLPKNQRRVLPGKRSE